MNTSSARKAAEFTLVTRPTGGEVKVKAAVPGHLGKQYTVLYRKEQYPEGYVLTGECLMGSGKIGQAPSSCPSSTVCYHVLAGIIATEANKGNGVAFANNHDDALRLCNLHNGSVTFPVAPRGRKGFVWAVTWKA